MNNQNKNYPVNSKKMVLIKNVTEKRCIYCGNSIKISEICLKGHNICKKCFESDALKILKIIAENTGETDPMEIMETVFYHPAVPMHGPEHHAIVPAVLAAAVKNIGYSVPENIVEQAIDRGRLVPGGLCGSHGACGAAVGVGVIVSILTGANPHKGKERAMSNQAAAMALIETGDGYTRCCKRVSRKSVEIAVKYLRDNMDINLKMGPVKRCLYIAKNKECALKGCKYFKPAKVIDLAADKT